MRSFFKSCPHLPLSNQTYSSHKLTPRVEAMLKPLKKIIPVAPLKYCFHSSVYHYCSFFACDLSNSVLVTSKYLLDICSMIKIWNRKSNIALILTWCCFTTYIHTYKRETANTEQSQNSTSLLATEMFHRVGVSTSRCVFERKSEALFVSLLLHSHLAIIHLEMRRMQWNYYFF